MSSGFVTETEAAEARKRRQEEWEKVRTPDQPEERPEEPYDGRSLYERLKEQKDKKDLDYEEAHKLKNLIRGLDDDEVQFLDYVDQTKMNAEKQQQMEEAKELKEFRERVTIMHEKLIDSRLQSEIAKPKPKAALAASTRPSQKSLLGNIVRKRKNGEVSPPAKAAKPSTEVVSPPVKDNNEPLPEATKKGALSCIAVLPGIGRYKDSSDSEMSSDSDEEPECGKFDLLGRKCGKKKCQSAC